MYKSLTFYLPIDGELTDVTVLVFADRIDQDACYVVIEEWEVPIGVPCDGDIIL